MNSALRLIACSLLLATVPAGLISCKQEKKIAASKPDRQSISPVTVEVRPDGLAYLPGAAVPFTGEAISPFPDVPSLIKFKEPYTDGKRDGDKLELYKNGTTKTLRRYEKGAPKYAASYHKNGQIKFELNLNAQDKGEGPYKRWYASGVVEGTSGLDAEERWHGDFKEWDPEGKLKTHHIFNHGLLQQIVFETEESQKTRKAAGLELQKPEAAPAPPDTAPAAPAAAVPPAN
jgi:hypothetical protein